MVDDAHARLDELVFTYLGRVDAGEPADEVLASLCAAAPEDAAALRRGVALLRQTQLHPGPARDGLPDVVGPFRLVRRLGAGGMGVVYLAQQAEPERRVALKLVRPDQLYFDGARERFAREVASAARLAHPGIAPIYEAGEHDGVPWFSQEYVVGASLDAVMSAVPVRSAARLTGEHLRRALADALDASEAVSDAAWDREAFAGSWVDVCLRIARQVADALQHAHERGVLHRDVKPSNVLLTPGGRAVLVDFGLATLSGAAGLTRTGAQVGSLAYMAPEQVDGRAQDVGPRSDVYALGVTLYETLTLQRPYDDASVERLRGLILEGRTPSPRASNPSVSSDAATVCICAMDRDPGRRYGSAAELSTDLTNVLTLRPIVARPAGPVRRLVRSMQRHPAAAVVVAVVLIAPLVFGVQRSLAALRLEEELARSESNFRTALEAIEHVMWRVGDEALSGIVGLSEVRLDVIDRALELFDGLARDRPADYQVRHQRAAIHEARADALLALGRDAEAADDFGVAVELLQELVVEGWQTELIAGDLGMCLHNYAVSLARVGRYAEAVAAFERSLPIFVHAGMIEEAGQSAASLAMDLGKLGRTVEVDAAIDRAFELWDSSPAATALDEAVRWKTRVKLCEVRNDLTSAAEMLEPMLVSIDRAVAEAPDDLDSLLHQAEAWAIAGIYATQLRDEDTAPTRLARALELYDALLALDPGLEHLADRRHQVAVHLTTWQVSDGDLAGAIVRVEELATAREELMRQRPDDLDTGLGAAITRANLAAMQMVLASEGGSSFDAALENIVWAREQAARILSRSDSMNVREPLASILHQEVRIRSRAGDVDGARSVLDTLVAMAVPAAEVDFRVAEAWAEWSDAAGVDAVDEICAALTSARDRGFDDFERIRLTESLGAFRTDPRGAACMERLVSP